jgi:hypothetical protein
VLSAGARSGLNGEGGAVRRGGRRCGADGKVGMRAVAAWRMKMRGKVEVGIRFRSCSHRSRWDLKISQRRVDIPLDGTKFSLQARFFTYAHPK